VHRWFNKLWLRSVNKENLHFILRQQFFCLLLDAENTVTDVEQKAESTMKILSSESIGSLVMQLNTGV
jgi:hypothetical protein